MQTILLQLLRLIALSLSMSLSAAANNNDNKIIISSNDGDDDTELFKIRSLEIHNNGMGDWYLGWSPFYLGGLKSYFIH